MNTKLTVSIGTALFASIAASLYTDDISRVDQQPRDLSQPHFRQRSSNPAKASQILGREITDSNDHKIGKVRELAVDLQNGRIVAVIVGTGGFLGFKEKDIAVPPEEFCWDPDAKKLVSQINQEQLRNAPLFDLAHWSDSIEPERIREIYHRYTISPYFINDSVRTPATTDAKPAAQLTSAGMMAPVVHLGPIERVRTIIGATVQNPQDERVGKVENVITDVAIGRVVVLVVSTGGFLDMSNEESAIPPQAFRYNVDQHELRLNTTREALRTAPHFKPGEWPATASSEHITAVYEAYNVPPYQNYGDVDNTAQNVRDRSGGNLTPLDQGASASDRAITARIRRQIMAHHDLSVDAHNIKIITVNGQVTLRGPVKSEEEEQLIIQIAKNAVTQDAKVTNQIQNISEPIKTSTTPPDSN